MLCQEKDCQKITTQSKYCQYHYLKNHFGLEYLRNQNRKKNVRYQTKLLQILGGIICNCNGCLWHSDKCIVTTIKCLQFDHKEGNGTKDQRKHGSPAILWKYYGNHPEEAREKLQVLYANCNWCKRAEKKEFS